MYDNKLLLEGVSEVVVLIIAISEVNGDKEEVMGVVLVLLVDVVFLFLLVEVNALETVLMNGVVISGFCDCVLVRAFEVTSNDKEVAIFIDVPADVNALESKAEASVTDGEGIVDIDKIDFTVVVLSLLGVIVSEPLAVFLDDFLVLRCAELADELNDKLTNTLEVSISVKLLMVEVSADGLALPELDGAVTALLFINELLD